MSISVSTLTELFLKVASYNKPDCLMSKVGGTYQPISTAELVDRVRRLSKALLELGVERGDRVALMSENGPHWPTIDFATLCAGAALVPIYPDAAAGPVLLHRGQLRRQGGVRRDHHPPGGAPRRTSTRCRRSASSC